MTLRSILAAGTAVAALAAAGDAAAQWKPNKPITIIVPWAAGGATDQVTRLLAAELEPGLGQKIVVVNQPGASGSIGTKNAWEAAKDGYTWTAGAPKQLGTYKLLGMFDTAVQDWHLYVGVTITPVISVNPSSQIQDMAQFLAALKARPNAVTVATAGATSSGHIAMEAIVGATGLSYRHVTYDGGNPAVVATVAGETEATSQLATEQAEMIRGKRLRPLAVLAADPLPLDGFGSIPAVTPWIAQPLNVSTHFGIMVPKGVPAEVTQTLDAVWADAIAKSAAVRTYAAQRGAAFTPLAGEAAQKAVWPTIQADAWIMHAAGRTKMAPDTIGIPKPTN